MVVVLSARELAVSHFEGNPRRQIAVLASVIACSLLAVRLVLALNIVAIAALLVLAGVVAVLAQPRWGVYLMFALVLLFDGGNADPLTLPGHYIFSSLQTTFHVSGGILIPFEALLLLTTLSWLAHGLMRQRLDFRGGAFGRPMLLFLSALAFGLVHGLVSAADVNYSLWESRFLFSMVLSYVLAVNMIRTHAHVRTLLTLAFVCISLSAIEGLWRKFALIDQGLMGPMQELWYSHDGMVVWGMLVLLVVAQQVFGAPRWQRILGPAMMVITLLSMLASERRAGLIAVMIALTLFILALMTIKRKAFFLLAVPALIATAIYMPLFWNNTGTLGQAARAVRSIREPDARDAASNAWRDLEAINVRATIQSSPLIGIGFGKPFLQVVTVPDISFFEFWNYESHHSILWIWMKMGAIGFILFFTLILGSIARAVWLARRLPQPELKVFAILALSTIVMAVIFSYVDLGLTANRLTMLLGVSIGGIAILDRLKTA